MELGLADRVVVITGASGGIGGALLDAFLGEGARVVAHGFTGVDALRERVGARDDVHCVGADLSDPAGAEHLFGEAVRAFGRVDAVAANAGHWPVPDRRIDETPVESLDDTIGANLLSAMYTARAFLRTLGEHPVEGASLVFTGSTAGRFGEAHHVAYATAKAGLRGLVRTLKNEITALDPWGRVNLVEPGWTATERVRAALDRPEVVERALRTMSLRQLARPVDIARAVLFLSSPVAARHVTGEILTVAGGMEGRILWSEVDVDAVRRRLDDD